MFHGLYYYTMFIVSFIFIIFGFFIKNLLFLFLIVMFMVYSHLIKKNFSEVIKIYYVEF